MDAEIAGAPAPCRVCLNKFVPGRDHRLLFTYDPFRDSEPDMPLPGPIYIHEQNCTPYSGNGLPSAIARDRLTFCAPATGASSSTKSIDLTTKTAPTNEPLRPAMSNEQRLAFCRRFRDAQTSKSTTELRAPFHDDANWVLPGHNAVSGEARGIDEIFDRFEALARFEVAISIDHFVVSRDGLATILHNTGSHAAHELDEHLVSTIELKEERITRIATYLSDVDMMDAYFTASVTRDP